MNKHRVLHFGYSANLGGVEVFIKNLIMNSSVPQDIVELLRIRFRLKMNYQNMEQDFLEYHQEEKTSLHIKKTLISY